ncbi:MAG: glycosyltransferase [Flavobacterium sp.]|nr:MAG: glycosyltransferase [Flavobacterium sp.]
MDKRPLVSVIVPVYNAELYLAQCIENITSQTYQNIEIIVVNDGSTDNSAEIAAQYQVKLIRQENQGVSVARNKGIDLAQGEYLHFMDVDDVINDCFYQKLVSSLLETGVDMACSEMINQRVRKETNFFKKLKVYRAVPQKLKITYVGRIGYVWRYLFKTEFIRNNKLRFEEGRIVEDLMFSLQAVYFSNGLVVVPGATYTYVHRENSQLSIVGDVYQDKRDRDWQHAKALRKVFAEKHGFKIPGVNSGKLAYFWWKFRNLYCNIHW